jgi:hypothetical protein
VSVVVDRIRKTLVLVAVLGVPAVAHSTFAPAPNLCIASGTATFRLAPTAATPDFRVRVVRDAARPDLRIQLVDSPELADFVIVDDITAAGESTACQTTIPPRTVKVDLETQRPDLVVSLAAEMDAPDQRVYVRSIRHSAPDAAALLAAMWKTQHGRPLAALE